MKSKLMLVIVACAACAWALTACGMPTSGFDNAEQRWDANQTTQPVAYHADAAPTAAEPASPEKSS